MLSNITALQLCFQSFVGAHIHNKPCWSPLKFSCSSPLTKTNSKSAASFEPSMVLQSTKAFKDIDIPEGRISIADVTKGSTPELDEAFKGISALIICTSAVPKMTSPPKVTRLACCLTPPEIFPHLTLQHIRLLNAYILQFKRRSSLTLPCFLQEGSPPVFEYKEGVLSLANTTQISSSIFGSVKAYTFVLACP